jgi:hypothetical protein
MAIGWPTHRVETASGDALVELLGQFAGRNIAEHFTIVDSQRQPLGPTPETKTIEGTSARQID